MKKFFEKITENALDFLNTSIEFIEDNPKLSIILFASSVELFLKARLAFEHWTLVVASRQEPDLIKFEEGDFLSVGIDDAARRIKKVLQFDVGEKALRAFKVVSDHRNKIIHFYHNILSDPEKQKMRSEIVAEQLRAWYFLHKFLTKEWETVFLKYKDNILEVDNRLRELSAYLEVIFDELKPEIDKKAKRGFIYTNCPACGFKSQEHDTNIRANTPYLARCLVCNHENTSIYIHCRKCNDPVIFTGEGISKCKNCGFEYNPENLAEQIPDSYIVYSAEKDGFEYIGNCGFCDGYHTVVLLGDGNWFCASCFEIFEDMNWCEWCNEPYSGENNELTSVFGCGFCSGNEKLLRD